MTKIEGLFGPPVPASAPTRRDCARLGHDFKPIGVTGFQVCREPRCGAIEPIPGVDKKIQASCGCEVRESQLTGKKLMYCTHYPDGLEVKDWLRGSRLCI